MYVTWTINWTIVGWVLAVLVFYLIGFYEGQAKGYKRRKREEEQEKSSSAPNPIQTAPEIKAEVEAASPITPSPAPIQQPLPPPQPAPLPPLPTPLPVEKPTPKKAERPSTPTSSIVEQINSILQERIAGTPLAYKRIFLSQSLEGGVVVHVEQERYNGINETPEGEVKDTIRAAIAEWEKKYTPGL